MNAVRYFAAGVFLVLVPLHAFAEPPYPPSELVTGIELDWSTHRREAQGSDNFQLTWSDDGHLYGAWGDGGGFGGTNSEGRVGLGVARVEGSAENYVGHNVWGGFRSDNAATFDGKSWGMIAIGTTLHMWVVPDRVPGKGYRNHYEFIELASSTDNGASWQKSDWRFEQSEDLTIPTFINCGRGYRDRPEVFGDYVYSYFIRPRDRQMEHQGEQGVGLVVHRPGVLYLARVRPDQIRSGKASYEFFAGLDLQGRPKWSGLDQKQPVFQNPEGVGWCLSACYHPGLNRVLLCTEHGESSQGLLGIYDAPTPWGPWTTVEYHTRDARFGEVRTGSDLSWEHNVFFIAFATKWFDGFDFTLNFTGAGGGRDNDSFNTVRGRFRRVADR